MSAPAILPCPSETAITGYMENTIASAERAIVDEHLAGCALCRETVSLLTAAMEHSGPRNREGIAFAATVGAAGIDSQDPPTRLVGGKYKLLGLIGEGGMGTVYRGRHELLARDVAIKFLKPGEEAEVTVRFLREARLAAQIDNPHVARVFDVGTAEDGTPYLVMELLDGEDLAKRILRAGAMDTETATRLMLQACRGVQAAHALGVIHRDLKPSNLFLAKKDGTELVKVLDFGIAKSIANAAESESTRSGAILGSPRYMSPEQIRATRDVDARTDVWSLGACIYEMLAGKPAFVGKSFTDLAFQICGEPPLRLASPQKSTALEEIALRCLEKDPAKRFATVSDLMTALESATEKAAKKRPLSPLVLAVGAAVAIALVLFALPRGAAVATPERKPVSSASSPPTQSPTSPETATIPVVTNIPAVILPPHRAAIVHAIGSAHGASLAPSTSSVASTTSVPSAAIDPHGLLDRK